VKYEAEKPINIEAQCVNCDWKLLYQSTMARLLSDSKFIQEASLEHEVEFDHSVSVEAWGEKNARSL
jgi:hypothetical protein